MSLTKKMSTDPRFTEPAGKQVVIEVRANCPRCSGSHRAFSITFPLTEEIQSIHCPICQEVLFVIGTGTR